MSEKKVPNPNGKKGGEKHQQKVREVFDQVRRRGFQAKLEHFLKLITGQGRFMDVAEIDNGTEIMYHQIGKQTKKGLPVKRERDVIEEVEITRTYQLLSTRIIWRIKTMMGRQINFYFMEEDIEEINNYLLKQGLIILTAPMKANKLELAESLFVKSRDHYISAPSLQNEILITYIDTQNYYLPDILDSPIIEFDSGHMRDIRIKIRGRVYYTKNKIGNGSPKKNELFLKMADDFFKWIRKNFKNVKLKGYEEFLISERTMQWLNESNDRKLGDFPEVLKQDIENRKLRVA